MTYKAIAIDDERFALDDLKIVITHIPGLELTETFLKADDALAYLHLHGPVDVIFCDLDLTGTGNPDELEGIRMADELKAWCTLFYFFTGHPAYRIAAIDTAVAGHLLKPVDPEKVKEGLKWITRIRQQNKEVPHRLLMRDVESGEHRIVEMDNICCLGTYRPKKNCLQIVCKDETTLIVYGSLKAMYNRIKHSGRFIQLSQSDVVAKDAIQSELNGLVKVQAGHYIPVGKQYREAFDAYLRQFT